MTAATNRTALPPVQESMEKKHLLLKHRMQKMQSSSRYWKNNTIFHHLLPSLPASSSSTRRLMKSFWYTHWVANVPAPICSVKSILAAILSTIVTAPTSPRVQTIHTAWPHGHPGAGNPIEAKWITRKLRNTRTPYTHCIAVFIANCTMSWTN